MEKEKLSKSGQVAMDALRKYLETERDDRDAYQEGDMSEPKGYIKIGETAEEYVERMKLETEHELRIKFATAALQGMLAMNDGWETNAHALIERVFDIADMAVIEAMKKR